MILEAGFVAPSSTFRPTVQGLHHQVSKETKGAVPSNFSNCSKFSCFARLVSTSADSFEALLFRVLLLLLKHFGSEASFPALIT